MTDAEIYTFLKNRQSSELIERIGQDMTLLNYIDSNGISLLLLSFYYRMDEVSSFILSKRSPQNIYEAAVCGNAQYVASMLDADPTLLNRSAPDGFTPLGLAAYFGRTDVVALLIGRNADPNIAAANAFKVAPLHSAVAANHYDIARILLEHGADPNVTQQKGVTPLHSAAHLANTSIASLLLKHGADKNLVTEDGETPAGMVPEEHKETFSKLLR